jgi:N-acetylmuramoyl-L-alanine amidase
VFEVLPPVKRALLLLVLGAASALAFVAAPALSLESWRPEPVDFELAAPHDAVLGTRLSANSGVISKPLRAPKRFNLVGLRWRGAGEPGVALRTRTDGGDWTRWAPLYTHLEDAPDVGRGEPAVSGGSNPAWVGEADWVQYRMTRRMRGVRLHFVNVQGTATAADRMRTALRGAVNTGLVALADVARADAAEPRPDIVPREDWGADDCPPRSAPDLGEVKASFIHHTVTANDYTPEEAPQIVLGICRFHRNSNGWNDIGYNFLVDKYGVIYEGRAGGVDQPVMGAHAQGYNAQSTGISNLGTHTSVAQTPEALDAMARLIRWKLPLHGTATKGSVVLTSTGGSSNKYPAGTQVRVSKVAGHRDTGATACPGEALYAQLPELRRLVGNVPASVDGTTTTLGLTPPRVDFGEESLVTGRVRGAAGEHLAGVPVELQRRSGGRWVRVSDATTGADGVFSAALRPRVNRLIRARFPGDGVLRASNSVQRQLGVRPVVEIVRPRRRGRVARAVEIAGRVSPRKRTLHLVVQYRKGGRWGRPGVRYVRARQGSFETSFLPGRSGRWRFYVVSKADEKTLRGASERYELTVSSAG